MLKEKKEKPKALYVFIKELKASNRTYKVGADCFQENENVLKYLINNKIIKKK